MGCVCGWKDVGMVIRKHCGVVPTLFGCFLGIPSLHVLSFFEMFLLKKELLDEASAVPGCEVIHPPLELFSGSLMQSCCA